MCYLQHRPRLGLLRSLADKLGWTLVHGVVDWPEDKAKTCQKEGALEPLEWVGERHYSVVLV